MSSERAQKRKRSTPTQSNASNGVDTSKPTAIFKPSKGRTHTVSVALPSSVVANAQTHDLKSNLIGTIARALSVFCVDEVIIFNDGTNEQYGKEQSADHAAADRANGYTAFSDPDQFMFHILSYLECPPHLRRPLFGFHPNLRTAAQLPSLDIPSHARRNEWCQYREGVTVDSKGSRETYVDAGLGSHVLISPSPPDVIPPNTRVTLEFESSTPPDVLTNLTAKVIAPDVPREEGGYYWGFVPRVAESLTDVFTECPYEGGYDFSIGMSERGTPLRDLVNKAGNDTISSSSGSDTTPPQDWTHLLIAFGGPAGLEKAAQNDTTLAEKGVTEASELFDSWINFMEGQGSRTIRSEEALWIGLMGCWDLIKARDAR